MKLIKVTILVTPSCFASMPFSLLRQLGWGGVHPITNSVPTSYSNNEQPISKYPVKCIPLLASTSEFKKDRETLRKESQALQKVQVAAMKKRIEIEANFATECAKSAALLKQAKPSVKAKKTRAKKRQTKTRKPIPYDN